MRRFGPKPADDPSIGETCPVCGHVFEEGDFTTLAALDRLAVLASAQFLKQRDAS